MGWATRDQAKAHWADAAALPDSALDTLLEVATEQCQAYAPTPAPSPLPASYVLATVYQAREVYAASQRGESDVVGVGDYAIRARPITAAVKSLLRPTAPGSRVLG